MMLNTPPADARTVLTYHMLRIALDRHGQSLAALDERKREQIRLKALQSREIESRVIASAESADVMIGDQQLENAVSAIRERYPSAEEFLQDLQQNGLDEAGLRHSLWRELRFDATLRRISAEADASISETDIRLFYELHRERFQVPETRMVRQILITINDDFAENTRAAARQRIDALNVQAHRNPKKFGQLARKHSECPSAVEAGLIGTVGRGQLFPALDTELFRLQAGEVSDPIETELGFHLLYCEQIKPAQDIGFNKARTRIREHLQTKHAQQIQKQWLNSLPRQLAPESVAHA